LENNITYYKLERFLCMKYLLIFLLFPSTLLAQKAYISRVIDQDTRQGLPAATVFNKKSKAVSVSNELGDFMIWASKGDSIEISSVGFRSVTFACKLRDTTILLKQDAQLLKAVIIKAKREEHLKEEIALFLKDPDVALTMKKKALSNMIDVRPSASGTPGLAISIDALWELFSKEGKSKRKLAALEQKDYKEYLVKERFSPQFVQNITHIKSEELELFMDFCNFSDDFILRATDYELTYAILRYKKLFKGEG
jgi:CarboxypepD_reg-like domain